MEIIHAINSPHVGGGVREAGEEKEAVGLLGAASHCAFLAPFSSDTIGEKMVSEIAGDFLFCVS